MQNSGAKRLMPCINVLQHASSKMSLASLRAATDKQTCHIYIQDVVADTENTLASQVRLCDTYYRQTCPLICWDL